MTGDSIAIIIDVWEYKLVDHSEPIINFLNTAQVSTAILASYNCVYSEYISDNIWYRNEREKFNSVSTLFKSKLLYEYSTEECPADAVSTEWYNMRTNSKILNYQNENISQIAMRYDWQIEYYLQENPQLENIFVLGASWDGCVRDRPLGYLNLQQLTKDKKINILTHDKCVFTSVEQMPNFHKENNWQRMSGNIYKYVPLNQMD